ncbi:hypothetical protein [Candidatus Magnetomonas plexicatena]|uniref:hypothetical protein n=1 Tax=Candidatus Magnetomonas plexicatena TaxID=2552947 RepID=UPI001C74D6C5|nr:hypothetical protein E2O03_007580 [Nitrospirales bacterium LBB_01]
MKIEQNGSRRTGAVRKTVLAAAKISRMLALNGCYTLDIKSQTTPNITSESQATSSAYKKRCKIRHFPFGF